MLESVISILLFLRDLYHTFGKRDNLETPLNQEVVTPPKIHKKYYTFTKRADFFKWAQKIVKGSSVILNSWPGYFEYANEQIGSIWTVRSSYLIKYGITAAQTFNIQFANKFGPMGNI